MKIKTEPQTNDMSLSRRTARPSVVTSTLGCKISPRLLDGYRKLRYAVLFSPR